MSRRSPACDFSEDIDLSLIDKDPGADANFLADALLCGCQEKARSIRHRGSSMDTLRSERLMQESSTRTNFCIDSEIGSGQAF